MSEKVRGTLDVRDNIILQALWLFEKEKIEATYNKLYVIANNIQKMPKQSFQNRLEYLMKKGLVVKREKTESKLNYKPQVYGLTRLGRTIASLSDKIIGLEGLEKHRENILKSATLTELFSYFLKSIEFGIASAPLFILEGAEEFVYYYVSVMIWDWCERLKERMKVNSEEFSSFLPYSLGWALFLKGDLPIDVREELSQRMKDKGINPNTVFEKAFKYKESMEKTLSSTQECLKSMV